MRHELSQSKCSDTNQMSNSLRMIDEVKTVDEFARSLINNNLHKNSSRKNSMTNANEQKSFV